MFEAGKYHDEAALAHSKADAAHTLQERDRHRDRARSLDTMADNEVWLARNFDKTIHRPEDDPGSAALAAEERHIIQCLGAALIMHWNTLPTKLQRELFDTAGAMGDLLSTPELRGQIARFLHKHKDVDDPTGTATGPDELCRSASGDRCGSVARSPEPKQ
jgi:hypothetical protein